MNITTSPKQIYRALILIVLVLTILSVVGQIYRYTIGHDRYLVRLFDLDMEWNIPTLFSVFLLAFASLLLFYVYKVTKIKFMPKYKYWLYLSIIFIFLSSDELMSFHNLSITPIRNYLNLSGFLHYAWILPGSLFVVIVAVVFFRFILGLPSYVRVCFILSAFLYIGGAIGVESLGGYYASNYTHDDLNYSLISNLEEVLEMLGVSTFIYAILYYLQTIDDEIRVVLIKT